METADQILEERERVQRVVARRPVWYMREPDPERIEQQASPIIRIRA
jgi:hypothetical protein